MKYTPSDSLPVIFPAPLSPGDRIVILSPAGIIQPGLVEGATRTLEEKGYDVRVSDHALGKSGTYSGTVQERLNDLEKALLDPRVKAILCSRGGYGAVHLLQALDRLPLRDNPKWIIGFSDISALHALMTRHGIASVHGNMAKVLAEGDRQPDNELMYAILRGERPVYQFESSDWDRPGVAQGKLVGGNLAVIAELINTPFDVIKPGTILFIEDVEEPIYKTERIMYQLRLSGVMEKLAGLIVGQFTDYKPNANYSTVEDMIYDMTAGYDFPIAMNVPIGHVDHNIPVINSATVTLKVSPAGLGNSLIFWK